MQEPKHKDRLQRRFGFFRRAAFLYLPKLWLHLSYFSRTYGKNKKKMEEKEIKRWKEIGKIGAKIFDYARSLIKSDATALEIAEKVEEKIASFKIRSAFPINISCNEIAAHCSPSYNDTTKIEGLVKIDIGLCSEGYICDIASSFDLTPEKKYQKLIKASEEALKNAIKIIKEGTTICEIGRMIQETISDFGFSPIRNLSGHELKPYLLHAGLNIPNYDNKNKTALEEGDVIAIEPFATSGVGLVQDSKNSNIYHLIEHKPIRDMTARKILEFIESEYKTLPFSSRWLVKRFGQKVLFSLRMLEQAGALHHFAQLVEKSKQPVSQAEHTILVNKDKAVVLTSED